MKVLRRFALLIWIVCLLSVSCAHEVIPSPRTNQICPGLPPAIWDKCGCHSTELKLLTLVSAFGLQDMHKQQILNCYRQDPYDFNIFQNCTMSRVNLDPDAKRTLLDLLRYSVINGNLDDDLWQQCYAERTGTIFHLTRTYQARLKNYRAAIQSLTSAAEGLRVYGRITSRIDDQLRALEDGMNALIIYSNEDLPIEKAIPAVILPRTPRPKPPRPKTESPQMSAQAIDNIANEKLAKKVVAFSENMKKLVESSNGVCEEFSRFVTEVGLQKTELRDSAQKIWKTCGAIGELNRLVLPLTRINTN